MARLILLDRDGVINVESEDFIKDADEWHAIPGALEAIAELQRNGFRVAVCSNQSGLARGLISPDAFQRINEKMLSELAQHGAGLDAVRYCPHHPDDDCHCRKPRPGMLQDVMEELQATAQETIFVGDSQRDLEAARGAGCHAALVRTGNGATVSVEGYPVLWVGDDLAAFARWLIGAQSC
jgi:D-glycero-D-manno-heptose 1,7-bisphosphate phosphatase